MKIKIKIQLMNDSSRLAVLSINRSPWLQKACYFGNAVNFKSEVSPSVTSFLSRFSALNG